MDARIQTIIECSDCKLFRERDKFRPQDFCRGKNRNFTDEDDAVFIPDWCPLPVVDSEIPIEDILKSCSKRSA